MADEIGGLNALTAPNNEARIAAMLSGVPTADDIDVLRDKQEGALGKVQAAYKSPSRGEDYSPFQEMVATYVKNIVPGWNTAGLGPAIAAPYFSQQAENRLQREGQIKESGAELGDAQKDLQNAQMLQRAGIGAAAGFARASRVLGGSGATKIINNSINPDTGETGSWWVKPDGTKEWLAGVDNEAARYTAEALKFYGNPDLQDAEAAKKIADFVNTKLEYRRKVTKPAGVQPPERQGVGGPEVLEQLSGPGTGGIPDTSAEPRSPLAAIPTPPVAPPKAQVVSTGTPEQYWQAQAEIPGFGRGNGLEYAPQANPKISAPTVDYAILPTGIQNAIQRILARDENATYPNPERAARGMEMIKQLVAPFEKTRAAVVGSELEDLTRRQRLGEATPVEDKAVADLQADPAARVQVAQVSRPGIPELKIKDFGGIEAQKDWGKRAIEERKLLTETSLKAAEYDTTADLMAKLISRPDVPEGYLGEVIHNGRSALKSLGFPVDEQTQAAADMLNAIATKSALQQRTANGQNLMPGALVTYEEKMLKLMAPGLGTSKEGSKVLLEFVKAINAGHRRIAEEANKMADAAPNKILPMSWETRKQELGEKEKLRLQVQVNRILKNHKLDIQE